VIADKFGVSFYTNRDSLHLFSEKKVSPFLFRLISDPRLAFLLSKLWRRRSLLENDYWDAVKRLGYSNGNETSQGTLNRGIGRDNRGGIRRA
jgi:hypothetical protein